MHHAEHTPLDKKSAILRHFNCSQCGAAVSYRIGEKSIVCNACGNTEHIETTSEQIVREYPLDKALTHIKLKPLSQPETGVLCHVCGATSHWQTDQLATSCPYCKTPIAKLDTENNRLQIEAIVPFRIEKKMAFKQLSKWLKNRWFAPNVLKEMTGHNKQFEGVYLPHWTFDSLTYTDYRGRRGEHYVEYIRQIRIVNGKRQTVEVPVTRTRWHFAAGQVRVMFDDILVLASMLIPKTIINRLRPWQLDCAEPYTEEYLAGLKANYYQLDLDDAFNIAKQRMSDQIDRAIRRDIGGDVQQILDKKSHYRNSTYKLILLPVWHSAFEYKGKIYQTVINGQTGKVVGNYPKSPKKIALAVVFSLMIFAMLVYLYASTPTPY